MQRGSCRCPRRRRQPRGSRPTASICPQCGWWPDTGNDFAAAQALNTQSIASLDPDRFLVPWRMVAGLRPYGIDGAVPYGGWMKLGPNAHTDLGHFSDHYLSATAFTVAATDDPVARQQRSSYLVGEIVKCQDAICAGNASLCGYVGAVPIALLEALPLPPTPLTPMPAAS